MLFLLFGILIICYFIFLMLDFKSNLDIWYYLSIITIGISIAIILIAIVIWGILTYTDIGDRWNYLEYPLLDLNNCFNDTLWSKGKSEELQKYVAEYTNISLEDASTLSAKDCVEILIKIPEANTNNSVKEYIDWYNSCQDEMSKFKEIEEEHKKHEKVQNVLYWLICF